MTAPRQPSCPLGRHGAAEPPSTEQACATWWHRTGGVAFTPQRLARLTPAHRSFVERIAAAEFGARVA